MKVVAYKSNEVPTPLFKTISELLHESFEERRIEGIHFKCGNFSAQDVENQFVDGGGYLLVVEDDSQVIGTLSLIERRKNKFNYISHDNLAVLSSYKGKGVASLLFKKMIEIAAEKEWDFITSFTAIRATSSVCYHLRMGFVIYEKSYGKGYDSYSFIYPLRRLRYMQIRMINRLVFCLKTSMNYIKYRFK